MYGILVRIRRADDFLRFVIVVVEGFGDSATEDIVGVFCDEVCLDSSSSVGFVGNYLYETVAEVVGISLSGILSEIAEGIVGIEFFGGRLL